jgi:hypothetical protein
MALVGSINAPNDFGFKNRIINGAMIVSQRNGVTGTLITADNQYGLDRWTYRTNLLSKLTSTQSTNAPAGFYNSNRTTVTTSATPSASEYASLKQSIEGYNISDLAFGTANAKPIMLSFWVYSSVTGTYGGRLCNSSLDQTFVFQYTVNVANTWEQKTISAVGSTSGTWLATTNIGLAVQFDLGSGSSFQTSTLNAWQNADAIRAAGNVQLITNSGANWYVTGVQIEVGSTATSFDYRPFGTELALCQRYFERSYNLGSATGSFTNGFIGFNTPINSASDVPSNILFKVTKRDTPIIVVYNAVSGASGAAYRTSDAASISVTGINYVGTNGVGQFTLASASINNYLIHYTASSEL